MFMPVSEVCHKQDGSGATEQAINIDLTLIGPDLLS